MPDAMANAATSLPLELDEPAPRRTRVYRASAGERTSRKRVTSFNLEAQDELVLDALRRSYGTSVTGQAIRNALRDAARLRGIDVDQLKREAGAV
jgi:hypothetical protein